MLVYPALVIAGLYKFLYLNCLFCTCDPTTYSDVHDLQFNKLDWYCSHNSSTPQQKNKTLWPNIQYISERTIMQRAKRSRMKQ